MVLAALEVASHTTDDDCWVVIRERRRGLQLLQSGAKTEELALTSSGDAVVFNVSRFLPLHPGGKELVKKFAGQDASKMYYSLHHTRTWRLPWKSPHIDVLGIMDTAEIRVDPAQPASPSGALSCFEALKDQHQLAEHTEREQRQARDEERERQQQHMKQCIEAKQQPRQVEAA